MHITLYNGSGSLLAVLIGGTGAENTSASWPRPATTAASKRIPALF